MFLVPGPIGEEGLYMHKYFQNIYYVRFISISSFYRSLLHSTAQDDKVVEKVGISHQVHVSQPGFIIFNKIYI